MTQKMLTAVVASMLSGFVGAAAEDVLSLKNPIFTPGRMDHGTAQTWEFRNQADNAIARVLVNSEGFDRGGAVPDGYSEYALRTQDEIRDRLDRVITSNDMHAMIRLMSRSFGYASDPAVGNCRGTQCPEMLEIYSDKHLRLTPGGGGIFDVIAGNETALAINRTGSGDVALPKIRAAAKTVGFVCIDDAGTLYQDPRGCAR